MAGLDTVPDDEQPPVPIIFWSFRIMVGIGFLMFGLGLWSLLARARGRLYDWPLLHRAAILMGPSGFVAVIAGWVTTEVGRQPWVVYGLLRTREAVTPTLYAGDVAFSLLVYVVAYVVIFGAGLYFMARLVRAGFKAADEVDPQAPVATPARPSSGATRAR